MDIIKKKNLEVPSKELEEENHEHTVECVPRTILNSGDSDSDGEDSEEDPEEEPEDDLEVEPVKDLEEEIEDKLEEGSNVEHEEDPEEDSSEEPEEQSDVECVTTSLPCHKTFASEKLTEDPDEDPSEEYLSEPYSMNDPEEIVKQEEDFGYAAAALHSKLEMPEAVVGDESGSRKQDNTDSGKRRRSRWEQEREEDRETVKGDRKGKKRKTRWDTDDSRLKFLVIDPEFQGLKSKLAEINSKLERSEVHDDRPEAERSPSPQPVYNNLGIRINTREVRLRNKLIQERQRIISKLMKKNPTFKTSKHKNKFGKKVFIPVEEYPTYNFIGLILGPKGNTQKRMEKETGATIRLRGKGSNKTSQKADRSDDENLHVFIEAGSQKSLDSAVSMVKKLLIPPEEGMSDHKRAQLEELAKLKQGNLMASCNVCNDPGHNHYACPYKKSTLKASCDTCGSFCHPTSGCPLTSSPLVSNPLQNSSRLGFGSAPKTKGKSYKEINAANLYVGYLPQAVDDNRLREIFSPFGTITQSRVARDHTTGLSKCHGFVRFDTPSAASLAISHMNGHQIDGHMLAVRVAGTPPTTGSSSMNLLVAYPGPLAAIPSVPSWQGPPQYMMPQAQVSFPNGVGLGLPHPSSVFLEHKSRFPQTAATVIPPPVFSSGTIESNSKTAFSAPGSGAMFPGDPDYSSGPAAMFPGDPDYPGGSEFQSYFSTRTL